MVHPWRGGFHLGQASGAGMVEDVLTHGRGWDEVIFKVSSNPNLSTII